MCRNLNVSKAGYYAWRGRKPSARARADEALKLRIRAIHVENKERYGSTRIHVELQKMGISLGRKRVARLMRAQQLKAKKRRHFRVATVSSHSYPIADNLLARNFKPAHPNRVWVSDITQISTREGWLSLAIVLDRFSRRIVGWSMSTRADATLVLSALEMAIQRRQPKTGLMLHSDRGSQYACREYRSFIQAHGIIPSMSRKANCWDNAVAESFFATLKVELSTKTLWATRREAHSAIFEFIESWYNRRRRHSTNGYLSPAEFEECRRVS
jgi:putative transposase